jgi:hypothetical protein
MIDSIVERFSTEICDLIEQVGELNAIDHVSFTSSTGGGVSGQPGETDTYTIWADLNETQSLGTFNVYNGADGAQGPQGQGIDHVSLTAGPPGGNTYTLWADAGETISLGTFFASDGPAGANGADGADGNTWSSGSGAPVGAGTNTGDQYLNTDNGDVYEWDGATWNITGNIEGPTGPAGPAGGLTPNKFTNIGGITLPAIVNNHHIVDNGHPTNPTEYELPDSASVGDTIKFTVLDGNSRVKTINGQLLMYGQGYGVAPVTINDLSWFAIGEGESLEATFLGTPGVGGSPIWAITNFQTLEGFLVIGTDRQGLS